MENETFYRDGLGEHDGTYVMRGRFQNIYISVFVKITNEG